MHNMARLFLLLFSLSSVSAQSAPLPKHSKIAIIGAGASGLTTAHTLRTRGFDNVTVYEKDERVGGKVYSVAQADQIFEVGAFWAGNGYKVVDELAKEYGVVFEDESIDFTVRSADGKDSTLNDFLKKNRNAWELAGGYYNWRKVQSKFGFLRDPGSFFEAKDPDLFLPFAEFVQKHHIEVFAAAFRPFWIGCGYGYYEDTPALYVLKMMLGSLDIKIGDVLKSILPFGGSGGGGLRRAPEGYQQIWVRMAQDLGNVRTGQEVERVTRRPVAGGYAIDITANGSTETYDALIVSADLKTALKFMDVDQQEQDLFNQVESWRYVIHLYEAHEMPYKAGNMVFLDAYGAAPTIGHMTAAVNRKKDPKIWTAGQLVPWDMPIDEATRILRQDMSDLGGTTGEIYQRLEWNYFPFVNSAHLQQGFYGKVKALQGQKSTWYVGGLMNFETVENTAAFARQLASGI